MRSIRLVVAASSSVLSVDDETKMNRKKHESSLLEALSDAGSTPAASTNFYLEQFSRVEVKMRSHLFNMFENAGVASELRPLMYLFSNL
jgi:hypothetical protein